MYLEISPRQSGKTTRLFNKVIKTCEKRKYCPVIVCGNLRMVQCFKQMLMEYDFDHGTFWQYQVEVISTQMKNEIVKIPKAGCKMFYDEFDFFPKDFNIFDVNGYYCTTPARIRKRRDPNNKNDLLMKLVRYKRGKIWRYSFKELSTNFPDNERFGMFLKGYYRKPQIIESEQSMEIYHNIDAETELLKMLFDAILRKERVEISDEDQKFLKHKIAKALNIPTELI